MTFEEWIDRAKLRIRRIHGTTQMNFSRRIWRELYEGGFEPADAADEVMDDEMK